MWLMEIFKATIETRNFTFEAYSETQQEAVEALRTGLERHVAQYPQEDGEAMEGIATLTFRKLGACYRDGEELE